MSSAMSEPSLLADWVEPLLPLFPEPHPTKQPTARNAASKTETIFLMFLPPISEIYYYICNRFSSGYAQLFFRLFDPFAIADFHFSTQ